MSKSGFRYWIRRLHRWTGLLILLPFAVICLSGVLLVFEPQLLKMVYTDFYCLEQNTSATAHKPAVAEVTRKIRSQLPEGVTLGRLTIKGAEESWCYEISSRRKAELFVDPYTCRILGVIDHDRGFFYYLRRIHRWLGDTRPQDKNEIFEGRIIVGTVSLAVIFVVLSGFYLGWPRRKSVWYQRYRQLDSQKPYVRAYVRHTLVGLLAGIPVIALAMTGLTWSFSWYEKGFYAVCASDVTCLDKMKQAHVSVPPEVSDSIYQEMAEHFPAMQQFVLDGNQVTVTEKDGTVNGFVFLDGQGLIPYPDEWQKALNVRKSIVAIHEGLWGGVFSQIMTALFAVAGFYLCYSGWFLYRNRHGK